MKILLKIFPQKSHYNATFPIARQLRDLGHDVVYAGIAPLERHVKAQGLSFFVQSEDVFSYVERPTEAQPFVLWTALLAQIRNRKWKRSAQERFTRVDPFTPLVRTIHPDILLVDSPYAPYALALFRHGVRFGILESMTNLGWEVNCPPLDTTFVPRETLVSRLIVAGHWRRYFAKRWLFGAIGFRQDYYAPAVRRRAHVFRAATLPINFKRYFHVGFPSVPEFILSPRPFDFPRAPAPNQVYVGPAVDMQRVESSCDYGFALDFNRIVAARARGTPIVYCSLGTGSWRYQGALAFLRRVALSARANSWNMIIAAGTECDLAQIPRTENVYIYQTVPQLQVLRQANAMITHGGMNSITECILSGVPMVVFPGTKEIDQAGNAARVSYHGIGVVGDLRRDSATCIGRKISAVVAEPRYRQRVASMMNLIITSDDYRHGASRLLAAFGGAENIPTDMTDICATA